MRVKGIKRPAVAATLLTMCLSASAQTEQADSTQPLATQIEDLKKALINLNRDLFVLEQDLLFPSSTQVAVYLSVDVGAYFKLDAVELKIDDEPVTHYLYTARQIDALQRGGVQQLYIGNIGQGEHEITAFFTGYGPESRPYKRGVTLTFEKNAKPAALELSIKDSTSKQQPEFIAKAL